MKYDVAIIGGGPAGYTAAEKAAAGGLSTVLFEKNALGGVCLNEGCVPTKTLLYSAKVFDTIKHAPKYAVSAENPAFDFPKIIARKNKVVKKLTAGIRMKMKEDGVEVVSGEAEIKGRAADGTITIASGEAVYEAANLLICTGSETVIPPIPGLAETEYWTSREALLSKELPASLVIIGGGVIGMEFASFFNSMGTEVHVVEMLDKILGPMDRELSEMLQAEYAKRGVKFYLGHKVTAVNGGDVTVEKDGETFVVRGEKILLSVGRRPVTKGFGLETLAPEPFRNGIKVNGFMQTSVPNVYACGYHRFLPVGPYGCQRSGSGCRSYFRQEPQHELQGHSGRCLYQSRNRRRWQDRRGTAGRRHALHRQEDTDGVLRPLCR